MPLAAGTRLGPYEILAPVGAGGMGEVYKARDTRVDRSVAIKISKEQFIDRLEREARAVATLNHPNICQLYDVGPNYVVMEFVEGSPVAPPENTRKLLDVAVQIADGLAAAHAVGITHRDLKPDNILLTRDGRVKILDFGLAKLAQTATGPGDTTRAMSITNPGTTVGTVNYMSPEQARGEPNLTPQSDQFSFGLVLYELASGKRAFQRPSAPETLAAIIREDAEPLPGSVSAPLRWVIERCLAKEPSARFESTRDLYRDLSSLRDHISEVLSPVSASLSTAKRARQRWIAPTVALIGVLLIGALGYLLGMKKTTGPEDHIAVAVTSSGGIVINPSFSQDASQVVFAWNGPRQENFNLYIRLIGSNALLRLTNDSANEPSRFQPFPRNARGIRPRAHRPNSLCSSPRSVL